MVELAWIASLVAVALASYHYQKWVSAVKKLQAAAEVRRKKLEAQAPESMIVDPDDVVAMAKLEHLKKMRNLNPGLDDEEL